MQIRLTLFQLQDFLQENGHTCQLDEERSQLFIIFKINDFEMPIFFKVVEDYQNIQIATYLPFRVDQDLFNDTARLLHGINCEIDLPGFVLDEKEETILFRIFLPCPNGFFNANLLKLYLSSIHNAISTYIPLILSILERHYTLEEIREDMAEQKS